MGLLGVIGGMGPFASAYFYKHLLELQKVKREQEQIDILIYSKPSIPDRSAFILKQIKIKQDAEVLNPFDSIPEDKVVNPFDSILEAGRVLENAGADCIAMPCVTAHFFYSGLVKNLNIPVINMAEETARRVARANFKKAGLLATEGTIKGRVLHNELEKLGVEAVILPEKSQQCLMDFIYKTAKPGGVLETETLTALSDELYGLGAEVVINGCTELSMAGTEWHGGRNIGALEVLAETALEYINKRK